MDTPAASIRLSELSRELRALTGQSAPDYRALYNFALNGSLPATRERGGWMIQRADLESIAVTLGLTKPQPAQPSGAVKRRARKADQPAERAAA